MLRTNRWGCSNIPDWLLLRRGGIPAPPAGTALVLLVLLLEARGGGSVLVDLELGLELMNNKSLMVWLCVAVARWHSKLAANRL